MTYFKNNLMAVLMICVLIFLGFSSATKEAFRECLAQFEDFCNEKYESEDFHFNPEKCAERAIMHWTEPSIEESYIFEYFFDLTSLLVPGRGMQDAVSFCSGKSGRCREELIEFMNFVPGDFRPNILTIVLKEKCFLSNKRSGNYMIDYLRHISKNYAFNVNMVVISPEHYCNKWLSSDSDSSSGARAIIYSEGK